MKKIHTPNNKILWFETRRQKLNIGKKSEAFAISVETNCGKFVPEIKYESGTSNENWFLRRLVARLRRDSYSSTCTLCKHDELFVVEKNYNSYTGRYIQLMITRRCTYMANFRIKNIEQNDTLHSLAQIIRPWSVGIVMY